MGMICWLLDMILILILQLYVSGVKFTKEYNKTKLQVHGGVKHGNTDIYTIKVKLMAGIPLFVSGGFNTIVFVAWAYKEHAIIANQMVIIVFFIPYGANPSNSGPINHISSLCMIDMNCCNCIVHIYTRRNLCYSW